MKKKINSLLIALGCLSCFGGYAQDSRIIEGLVQEIINGKREACMGINVIISNEQNRTLTGTVTDIEGKYVLRVPDESGKLKIVFSFIGMKPQTFPYTGQRTLDVLMEVETHALQDVVITAKRTVESERGITSREQTFASQKLKLDAVIETMPVSTIEEALQGKIAGLDILTGGDPGSRSSIRIRGTATLNSSADPLIVINGVPYSTTIDDLFDFNTANDEDFAAMLNLNPHDIESIEVLKDAASTSIYGTAGSNGVLLVTTKKGARGKTSFSVSSKNNLKIEPKPMAVLSGNQYVAFIQDAIWNTANAQGLQNSAQLLNFLFDTPEINYNPGWRYFNEYNANTDWLSYVKRNAFSSDNSFSMSGGGEKATYRFSMSYMDEGGTTVGTGMQRLTSNLNIGYYFSDKLRVEADFSHSSSDKQDNWTTALRSEALRKMPNKSPFWMTVDPNGNVMATDNYFIRQNAEEFQGAFSSKADGSNATNFHPIIMANESFNNTRLQEERMLVQLRYDLLPGLLYSGYVSMRFKTNENRKFLPQAATDVSVDNNFANRSTDAYSNQLDLLTENKLSFRKNWNAKHELAATTYWRTEQTSNSNYSTDIYGAPAAGMSDPVTGGTVLSINSGESEGRTVSSITSVAYTFLDRYVLAGTFNYEGKSSLGKNNRWGAFPSLGVNWQMHEEAFMRNIKWLDVWTWRFSYGQSGDAPGGTAPYVGTYASVDRYITAAGIAPASMQLNKLKWATSTEYDLGIEASFFGNKLTMVFDYYNKYTKDLLQKNIKIPSSTGYDSKDSQIAYYNSGAVSNEGIEYRFDYRIVEKKQWRVSASFNMARNINTIESLPDNLVEQAYSLKNGEYAQKLLTGTPTGSFFGFRYLGVYQNLEDTYAKDENNEIMYNLEGNPIVVRNGGSNGYPCYPGDAKYEDINHDGVIDMKDIVYIGNCMPIVTGGMGANVTYQNLSVNLNFHYRLGQKVINKARMNSEAMYGSDNQSKAVLRRWRNPGDDTDIPRALWDYGYNYLGSDRFVDDASYLRLQSISFNYRFPKRFCEKLHVRTFSAFLTIYDAYTWTRYNGQDPEVNLPKKVTDLAMDNARTPRSSRYAFGLNLNF